MEEPSSHGSEGDVRRFHPTMASPEKDRSSKVRGRENTRFRIPSIVVKETLPTQTDVLSLADPVARSLRLDNKKMTGKHFAHFNTAATRKLINGRWVVFIGDSVVRAMYKDLVHMVNNAISLVYPYDLAKKGEISFEHDQLLHGDKLANREPTNGIDYEEVRAFLPRCMDCRGMISFCFTTKFWNSNLERTLKYEFFDSRQQFGQPDVVFANSCLWDLARYGDFKNEEDMKTRYRNSVETFIDEFKRVSNNKTLLVIMSTLPVSTHCTGAFLLDEDKDKKSDLWKKVKTANIICAKVVKEKTERGYSVVYLDLHTLAINLDLSPWMENDGTHWKPPAHRVFSYCILSFMQSFVGMPLPTENFDAYLRACDDLFRFNEYRRWLALRIMKKTRRSMEEIIRTIEDRFSKKDGDLEIAYAHDYSRRPPARSFRPNGHAKQIARTSVEYGYQPPPLPLYPPVPSLVPFQPVMPFALHQDTDFPMQSFSNGCIPNGELQPMVPPAPVVYENIKKRHHNNDQPSSSVKHKASRSDRRGSRTQVKSVREEAVVQQEYSPKLPMALEEYNPEYCIHNEDEDLAAGADAEQFYNNMFRYTFQENNEDTEVRNPNNIIVPTKKPSEDDLGSYSPNDLNFDDPSVPTAKPGRESKGVGELMHRVFPMATSSSNVLLPTSGLLQTPGLLPEPPVSQVPLPHISTLAEVESVHAGRSVVPPGYPPAPPPPRASQKPPPPPPLAQYRPPPPPRAADWPPPPPPPQQLQPPPPPGQPYQDYSSDVYYDTVNQQARDYYHQPERSAGWNGEGTSAPYAGQGSLSAAGQTDYSGDEYMDWEYQ
ncbi:uncharacterized protein LOC129585955 [Paramacrobiotus metropolitanus]|uniref:uncharacterized protein LOC129585955 n=1 Tax=Paramacrobiotus metropolitanus TaxID=2943436 RepID=UPI00244590BD|nr:uncharacterized protein LOC129585955 [Paramacrobiotus metropolitanus]